MDNPQIVMLVVIGGGLGSVARWLLGLAIAARWPSPFPLGTFVINVTGAFAMGFLSTMLNTAWQDRLGSGASALLLTGVLGGYTTFSSYELDTSSALSERRGAMAALYWTGSIAAGLIAAALGYLLAAALSEG